MRIMRKFFKKLFSSHEKKLLEKPILVIIKKDKLYINGRRIKAIVTENNEVIYIKKLIDDKI